MLLTLYDQYGNEKAELQPNDSSTQDKEIQADNVLSLGFTLYQFVTIDVNDYVDYFGERYWAVERYLPSEKSSVEWEYDIKFYAIDSLIKRFLVLNNTDGGNDSVFTLTARPIDHVRLIVKGINDGMGQTANFKVGTVEGTDNVVIRYEGKYCDAALKELAEAVGVEWWFDGETVNLCRCEHGIPIVLGYGEGLTGLEHDKADNAKFYTRLFPIGSSRNIDSNRYGSSRLQLPDGVKYVDIDDLVSKYGIIHHYEQNAFSGIFPRRVGVVSRVRSEEVQDTDGNPFTIYYFSDDDLSFDPNEYEIGTLVKRISFQEGSELAGLGADDDHYFEVNYDSQTREFEIITIWPYDDGRQLPGNGLVPKAGDRYVLWNIRMPDEYYGMAEAEFRTAVDEYNRKHTQDVSRYKATTDHVWMEETGTELFIGSRVCLKSTEYFPPGGHRESRITRIRRNVCLPGQMDLEISDALSTGTLESINDAISDARSYVGSVLETVNVPALIRSRDTTKASDYNVFSALRSLKEFVSKRKDDIMEGLLGLRKGAWFGSRSWRIDGDGNAMLNDVTIYGSTTLKGVLLGVKGYFTSLFTDIIQSSDYTGDGLADTGFKLTRDDGTGSSRLTVDNLHVRKKATFEELEVKKDTAIAGNQVYSAAANVISRTDYLDAQGNVLGYSYVRVPWLLRNVPFLLRRRFFGRLRKVRLTLSEEDAAGIVATRCYFLASDGDREVRNLWRADDQNGHDLARCQTFNLTGSNRASYLSGHGRKAGNVYWWRKVVAASSSPVSLDDGQEYHYIDVSMTQCDAGSDIPCAGDHVVQFGNDSNPDRMNLKVTEVNGGDAPADKYYRGVYTFDLNKSWWGGHPRKAMISPSGGYEFHGPSFRLVQEYGERPASIDRGAWSEIPPERDDYSPHGQVRKCYYYDKVSHKGCYWLCVLTPPDDGAHWTDAGGSHVTDNAYSQMPDAQKATCTRRQDYTTVEPGTDDSVWQKQVDRGTSVKGVRSYYAKAGMKLSMPEDDRQVTWKDSLSALGDIGEGWYVWTKNVTTYSDTLEDTATYTVSRQGIDGDGIHSIETKFHESRNLLTQAQLSALTDSQWKEYRELDHASGDFIYTRTKITYDKNDTPTVSYGVNRIGQDGVSYVATEEYYALGGSETAPPAGHPYTRQDGKPQTMPAGQLDITGDWSESRPVYQGDQRKYLWNFEVCYDTTSVVQVTQPVCIGNFARGIVSIVELYAVSAESVLSETVKALEWTDEVFDAAPTDEKPYQWNKTVTSYSDGTSDTFYHVSGVRGSKGSDGKDGKEGIPGQNGKDGWMIAASPANVILTQSLSGSLSSFSSCTVGFTLMKGGTPVGVGSIGTPSSSTFNVSRNGSSVIVSSPRTNDGSYNTEGSFTVKVYATDPDTAGTVEFEMSVPCYANLLGTWKEAVEGGVKEIAAEQTRFEIENGNLVKNDNTYKAMQNAVASQEEWKAAMTGAGGWMEQTNSRVNTAEESIQTLEQKVATVYDASMFSVDEWAYGNMTATAGISLSGNSNDLGNGRRIRSTMLLPYSQTMRFDLHAGWGIQFIFYDREGLCTGKSTNRIIADDSISGESIGAGYLLPAGTSFIGVVLGKGDNGVLDSVSRVGESGFRVYDRENSTSVIQQTATLIRQEVAGTGIDIMKGKINLRGDKVTFSSSDGTVTDKVGIDPATGTLHMENAVISGATMIDSVKVFRDNDITLGSPVYLHVYEHADDPSSGDTYLKDIRLKGNRFIMRCWKGGNYPYLRELNIYIPPAEYFKGQTIVICNSLYCTKAYSSSVYTKVKTTLMVDLTLTLLSKEVQDAGDIAYSDSVVGKLRPSTGQLYVLQANEEWLVNGIYCHDAMTGVMGTLVDSLDISDYEWLELTAWESEFYDAGNALRHAVEWKMLRWSKGGGES